MGYEIAEKTIALRQQYKTKTPDAIIAANALVHGLSVATNNTYDFKRLGVGTSQWQSSKSRNEMCG
ncbi:PIN domain-containing protein [Thiothrix lacustris]|uniref:PIN domain-containing protein n=1 Tax=Thiothrix lacustris TaxID=525917 RepID=UPI00355C158C